MEEIERLARAFGDCPGLSFVKLGELSAARIDTPLCRAMITIQGAQVTEWQPRDDTFNDQPVLWLARAPEYRTGKAVRGGVPICWPWFGDHPTLAQPHGFARNVDWTLKAARTDDNGAITLHWQLVDDRYSRQLWPHAFHLDLHMHLGEKLHLALTTTNTDGEPFSLTQGLHTYLRVGDIRRTVVRGLEGTFYLDKLTGFSRGYQDDAIEFDGPFDRIFLGTRHTVEIEDRVLGRGLRIEKAGSHSTVIWNPGRFAPADMETEEYRDMLCVEATNAADDLISIQPGQSKTLETTISQFPLA